MLPREILYRDVGFYMVSRMLKYNAKNLKLLPFEESNENIW